jgi:polygalacturonase
MGMENKRPTEHITVTNCVLRTNCSNFKFGTESTGDFRNIAFTNCTMHPRDKGRRPISGISLEAVDGAHIDGVVISNVVMEGVETPVFIRLGNRGRGMTPPTPGSVQNISISNIIVRNSSMASSVTGIPGAKVKRVSLDGFHISMEGGSQQSTNLDVPENIAKYPEGNMFGPLPAYGFYGRHTEGLALTNFQVRWDKEDVRPAMVFDDVKDLSLDGVRTDTVSGASPIVWLNNVTDALIRGVRTAAADLFLRVGGNSSNGITVIENDLSRVTRSIEITDAPKSAVRERPR